MEEIPSTLQPFDNQNLLDFNQVEQTKQVLGCFWLAFWGNGYYSPWKSHLANPILVFNHQLLKQSPFQRGSRSQEMSHFLKGNHDFSRWIGQRTWTIDETGLMLIPFPHSSPNFYVNNSLAMCPRCFSLVVVLSKNIFWVTKHKRTPKQPLT